MEVALVGYLQLQLRFQKVKTCAADLLINIYFTLLKHLLIYVLIQIQSKGFENFHWPRAFVDIFTKSPTKRHT